MTAATPLRSIAVFGGGVVALSAAIAFARALPRADVILVKTPITPDALADRFPLVWPTEIAFLDQLGLDARGLIACGAASPRLAQRFADWGPNAKPWLVPDGAPIAVAGSAPLHQRWLDAVRAGAALPFHALFPTAVMAEANRYDANFDIDHALAFDPAMFGAILDQQAQRSGVRIGRGAIASIERDDADVAVVRLLDGSTITADLCIDATGPTARIAGDGEFLDWSDALPCDRLLVTEDRAASPSLCDDHRAVDLGWSGRWSRPRGGVCLFAYGSQTSSDERARRTLGAGRDAATVVTVRPGRRTKIWARNVLALGDAAVQPGALGNVGLSHAFAQLALAMDLLPGRTMPPMLLAEFNRRATLRADRLCDLLAAFYHAGPVRRGPFWRDVSDRSPPPGLSGTLRQFSRNGHLPHHDEDGVDPSVWHTVLLGRGIRPECRDPLAMAADPRRNVEAIQAAADDLKSAVSRLPPYAAHVPFPTSVEARR